MAEKRAVTMKEVAERAGVSKACVSAVLGGGSRHVRVSEATRLRVLQTAAHLQYRPNPIAQSLRRRCTNIIGFYNGYGRIDAREPFLAEIIGGLQDGCEAHCKDLLLYGAFQGRSVEEIHTALVDGRIDQVILIAPPDDPLVDRLANSPLPVVAIVDAIPELPSVVVDDAQGSRLIVEYLANRGHKRVLYRSYSLLRVSVERRCTAFREAAAAHRMEVLEWRGPYELEAVVPDLDAILCAPYSERPTAAVCWSDRTAHELLLRCRKLGLRVPEDMSIVGFDGLPSPNWSLNRLTTAKASWDKLAQAAVHCVIEQLPGSRAGQEVVLPVSLQCGDTA